MADYYPNSGQPQGGGQPQGAGGPFGNAPQAAGQPGYTQYAYQQPQQTYYDYGQGSYATAPAAGAPAPQKKGHGWIIAIVAIVCVCVLCIVGVVSCSSALGDAMSFGSSSLATADTEPNTVATINIDDTIQYDGTANSPEGLKSLLDQAAEDDNIKAVVLRVNSGGGTATAGEEMAAYVREFRETSGKPVVVSSASLNASAAYEISSQADYIFVAKTTEIGAIGTVLQTYDVSELMDKLGISVDNIASADSKDSTYGTRPLTDEEKAYYQSLVNEINETFIQNVADGRHMSTDEVRKLATGMVFVGTTAVTNGIADEIGTYEDAETKAAELAGIRGEYNTYSLEIDSYDFSDLAGLLGSSSSDLSEEQIAALLKEYTKENGIQAQ